MEDLLIRARDLLAIPWVRAAVVIVLSIVIGKAVDIFMCRALRRLTRRSKTELDDQLIDHLHRPIFVSVVLFGLYLSVEILRMPEPYAKDPWVVFPGTLQGRHARETGAKGCTIVSFEDGEITRVEHRDVVGTMAE